jgi:hypothetical protein
MRNKLEEFTKIEEGYRVLFSSWENDGDFSHVLAINGLTDYEAHFYIELSKLFSHSYHDSDAEGNQFYGNLLYDEYDNYSESLFEDVMGIFDRYEELMPKVAADKKKILGAKDQQDAFDDILHGYLYKIYGSSGGDNGFKTRVVDDIKVFYIPTSLTFKDVTSEFTS